MPEITHLSHLTTDVEDEVFCSPTQSWGHRVAPGDYGADDDSCSQCGAILYADILAKHPNPKEENHGA